MNSLLKILVITDSLGLPRKSDDDLVPFEETWVNKLKEKATVHQISIGGATIYQLYEQIKYNELFNPDLVLVQSGIVDCAPRAFKMAERQLLQSIPLVRNVFSKVSEKYGKKIRNMRNISYTKPDLFKLYVQKIINDFKDKPVYFIGIVPAPLAYERKMKGITKNIEAYNSILKNASGDKFIETNDLSESGLLSDYHHLSVQGNQLLFEKIVKLLPQHL